MESLVAFAIINVCVVLGLGALVVLSIAPWLVRRYRAFCVWFKLPRPNALPLRAWSSGEVIYTWEDWTEDSRKAYPVRYFFQEGLPTWLYRPSRLLKNAWYWIRCHTYNRYHLVDIRNPFYEWGYLDQDAVILYAAFAALVRFVEEEEPFRCVQWDPADEAEIKSLYAWWTSGRKADLARLESDEDERGRLSYWDLEVELEQRDQQQLHRLIEIRPKLWT